MGVEMPFRMLEAIGWRLMKAHRIRKRNSENFVVTRSHAVQNVAQGANLIDREFVHASEVPPAANQNLERPNRPEGNQCNEPVVFRNHSYLLPLFQRDVVT